MPERQVEQRSIDTGYGRAEVILERPVLEVKDPGQGGVAESGPEHENPGERSAGAAFLLALTHGAGGGVGAPDLLAARDAALRLGGVVARVTQPYRVRGARAPGSAVAQDAAWTEIIAALRDLPWCAGPSAVRADAGGLAGGVTGQGLVAELGGALPLLQGGRSNGARVACRTAAAVDALGVIALAFPLHPPGRPERSRAAELRLDGPKLLLVCGERDPFGVPGPRKGARRVVLPGETHELSRNPAAVGAAVAKWLPSVLALAGPADR